MCVQKKKLFFQWKKFEHSNRWQRQKKVVRRTQGFSWFIKKGKQIGNIETDLGGATFRGFYKLRIINFRIWPGVIGVNVTIKGIHTGNGF